MIGAYGLYLAALYNNEFLETWANTLPLPFKVLQNGCEGEMDPNYIPLEDRTVSTHVIDAVERNSLVQSNGRIISSIQQTYQSNKAVAEKDEIEVKYNSLHRRCSA